jgi:hypothetical protein
MPTIVMTKGANKLEPEVKKKAYAFLEKLAEDDTTLGLHIEPITNSADPRVRTGRVDQSYRAVLFKIPQHEDNLYVFHGIFPHDEAIAIAKKTVMTVNPVNGVTELRVVSEAAPAPAAPAPAAPAPAEPAAVAMPVAPTPVAAAVPVLARLGFTAGDLTGVLGIDELVAVRAIAAADDDALLAVATDPGTVEWQGLALLDLAAGHGFDEVKEKFDLVPLAAEPEAHAGTEDEQLVRGLQRPAAQLSFTYIGDDTEELRRVIEGGDFGAWRVFLHPEQRRYAERRYNGPFRLAGGAGTGKTVVILHRARNLSRRDPAARVLVTTFTTNLADAMRTDLQRLDPTLPLATTLGEPGVYVTGIDALASAVLRRGKDDVDLDVQAVLGATGATIGGRMIGNPWAEALDAAGSALPEVLRNEAFLEAEYNGVVLPHRITGKDEYLKVRRPGRGVALDRGKRSAVWDVVAACRAQARVRGGVDFPEACAIAAAHLARVAETDGYLFDRVLVDEGQDLAPTHWQLLRALVGEHADDLFIAEDSHQRIYGRRVVLSQFGIKVVGRSRRLTLNYRTTAQNLDFAMKILLGGEYLDLEDAVDVSNDYRSARSGPLPRSLACTGLTDELDTTARVVGEWADGATAPETIAVLVRDRWQRDRVAAGLAERGVQIRSVDREPIKPGQPVVMTMHRAKGTEFSRVLLFDVSEGAIPAPLKDQKYSDDAWEDALLRERSLVYVAATRARDELAITYNGKPSTFVMS